MSSVDASVNIPEYFIKDSYDSVRLINEWINIQKEVLEECEGFCNKLDKRYTPLHSNFLR